MRTKEERPSVKDVKHSDEVERENEEAIKSLDRLYHMDLKEIKEYKG
jgi:hypothetical protein